MTTDDFRAGIERVIASVRDELESQADGSKLLKIGGLVPPPLGTPKRFVTIVSHVIQLANARSRAEERDSAVQSATAGSDSETFQTGTQHSRALRDYLALLGDDEIQKLRVLMYSGREREPFFETHRTLAREPTNIARSTIAGKSPLGSYLQAGMHMADAARVDLEAPLITPPLQIE